MRRITLTVVAILLAVPAVASAKVGVGFDRDPATVQPGEKLGLNVMIMRMPRGPNGGEPKPIVGERPLVTFRSASSGKVIHVRAGRSDRDGIARAGVRFPDHGPWSTTIRVNGRAISEGGRSDFGGFSIGIAPAEPAAAVDEVVRPPAEPAPARDGGGSPAIGWILLGLGAALAGLAFTAVRMRIPARLRARLGGGA